MTPSEYLHIRWGVDVKHPKRKITLTGNDLVSMLIGFSNHKMEDMASGDKTEKPSDHAGL